MRMLNQATRNKMLICTMIDVRIFSFLLIENVILKTGRTCPQKLRLVMLQ